MVVKVLYKRTLLRSLWSEKNQSFAFALINEAFFAFGFKKLFFLQSIQKILKSAYQPQTSKYIDCLTACTACLVCFISTVNGRSKKKKLIKTGTSSRHITNIKQSIFVFRYLWFNYNEYENPQYRNGGKKGGVHFLCETTKKAKVI